MKRQNRFTFVRVTGLHITGPRRILGFKHKYGVLECTAAHKVLRVNEDRHLDRIAWARVNRVWRQQYPAVVRGPGR